MQYAATRVCRSSIDPVRGVKLGLWPYLIIYFSKKICIHGVIFILLWLPTLDHFEGVSSKISSNVSCHFRVAKVTLQHNVSISYSSVCARGL